MIELLIKNYLDGHLDVPSFFRHEKGMPDSYVIFEKTGSSEQNLLKSATFAFQSYGFSIFDAAKLNEKVKEVVKNMSKTAEIASVRLNSDYNYTDTETKQYRYQAVFEINYY